MKKLKKLKNTKRDALLERFYFKCRRTQTDRFFAWRERFLKLNV
jgi:hypothetical protein